MMEFGEQQGVLRLQARAVMARGRQGCRALILLPLLGLLAVGCAHTTGRGGVVPTISVNAQGTLTVDDAPIMIEDLPRTLQRARVPSDRTLVIHFADDSGKRLIPEITRVLRRAGYRKLLFTGEHKASATVAD